jgi:DNA polymerase III subunit gamma/tau
MAFEMGSHSDVQEIDAASQRGIDNIRELQEISRFAPRFKMRVVILDECQALTDAAWRAFLKTLEEPPAKTVFILVTTEPGMLPDTIISRCSQIPLNPVTVFETAELLMRVAQVESIPLDPAAATLIAEAAYGHPRNALTLLEQAAHYLAGSKDITAILPSMVEQHLKLAPKQLVEVFVLKLLEGDTAACIRLSQAVTGQQEDFVRTVIGYLYQVIFKQIAPKVVDFSFTSFLSKITIPVNHVKVTMQIDFLDQALFRLRKHDPDPVRVLYLATLKATTI